MKHIRSFQEVNEQLYKSVDKFYLFENVEIENIKDNIGDILSKKEEFESIVMATWEKCKKNHKFVRLNKIPQQTLSHLYIIIMTALFGGGVGGPPGLVISTILSLLGNITVFKELQKEIENEGPESQTLKQEIMWVWDCFSKDPDLQKLKPKIIEILGLN